MVDSQIDPKSIQNKYLLFEIKTVKKSLLFRMKNIIDGVCLFDDRYFIIFNFIIDT